MRVPIHFKYQATPSEREATRTQPAPLHPLRFELRKGASKPVPSRRKSVYSTAAVAASTLEIRAAVLCAVMFPLSVPLRSTAEGAQSA